MITSLHQRQYDRYQALSIHNIRKLPQWQHLERSVRRAVRVVSQVLPFRTNEYVTNELINWDRVPDDPIFRLTFPQAGMLSPQDFQRMDGLLEQHAPQKELRQAANEMRLHFNPHPAGQMTHNVPELEGEIMEGMQHKYRETVLFFPARGQTCHAYCTYCFRWAQFVGVPEIKFEAKESEVLADYLRAHPGVTDLLVTGGDPMIMKTEILRKYLEPVLSPELAHVQTIRIGTKSLAYWPLRYLTDDDADDCLRFFEEIVEAGRHLAIMAHFSHWREMDTPWVRRAIARLRSVGAEIRIQAPLVRHVNDDAQVWATMWRKAVALGMVPYYMFVARNTGPKAYFEVPLAQAHEIFRDAFGQVSGLARTVRGPSMSAFPGKVRVLGTALIQGERVFTLDFLQARNAQWVGRPFFARFDPEATWLTELKPWGADRFFFEDECATSAALAR